LNIHFNGILISIKKIKNSNISEKSRKNNMKYFVTGGTGFIGRRLIKRIMSEGGTVHLAGRESSDYSELDELKNVKIYKGSLNDKQFLTESMKGTDVVIHLAGYAKNWAKDSSIYKRINIDASVLIAEVALELKIKKMIHVSTIVALGPTGKTIFDENVQANYDSLFTDYEKTKAEAERRVLNFAQKGLNITSVNPTRVFGPGVLTEANSLTLLIRNYLKYKNYLLLGTGRSIANYVYVDDIVDGILKAVQKGKKGERYILGSENISFREFFKKVRIISGKRAFPICIPKFFAMSIASFEELMARLFGKYPLITRPWVKHFFADWIYSNEKAIKELGYKPRSIDE
jgi:nucleoside-diphosphate-sugar epimerase